MMSEFEKRIFEELVREKKIQESDLEKIQDEITEQEKSFELVLAEQHKIDETDLLKAKASAGSVGAYSLRNSKISKDILNYIPIDVVQQYKMVPIMLKDSNLVVGMVNPTDLKAKDVLRFIFFRRNLTTDIVAITEKDFEKTVAGYQAIDTEVNSALEEIQESNEQSLEKHTDKWEEKGSEVDNKMLRSAPIVKVVAVILRHAIEGNASDIHIESSRENTRVRFRLDGVLHTNLVLPLSVHSAIVARIKILASLRLDESRIPQDGRFSTTLKGTTIDFRVSTFPTSTGEKVVLRVLNSNTSFLSFDVLGMQNYQYKFFEEAIHLPYGMILVSGPTGSGKSTTLYAALNLINDEEINIVSLEDPVEYHMKGVNQSQTRADIGYTFATGLRHILRQDPDVILVGEIRDTETAALAVQASLTGHLLFSSIHTNNAVGVIPRLVDMKIDAFLLASSLSVMIAQRLIGRLCQKCSSGVKLEGSVAKMVDKEMASIPPEVREEYKLHPPYEIRQSKGCHECHNTKVKGRLAVYELLRATTELKSLILKDPSDVTIAREAQRQGMITMKQDGIIKALQGKVALEEVLQKTSDD